MAVESINGQSKERNGEDIDIGGEEAVDKASHESGKFVIFFREDQFLSDNSSDHHGQQISHHHPDHYFVVDSFCRILIEVDGF